MCTYGDVWDVIIDVTQRTVCHKRIGYATVERMVDGPYPRAVMLQLVTQQVAVLGIPSLLRHPQLAVHRLFNLHGQIGRASCRERVAVSVDIGGRRTIKNKNSTDKQSMSSSATIKQYT